MKKLFCTVAAVCVMLTFSFSPVGYAAKKGQVEGIVLSSDEEMSPAGSETDIRETDDPMVIDKISVSARGTDYIGLRWDYVKKAVRYEVWRLDQETGEWVKIAETTKPAYVDRKLPEAEIQTYAVRACTRVGYGRVEEGEMSSPYHAATKPEKVTISSAKKGFPGITVSWKERKCDGYEIYASGGSSFQTRYIFWAKDPGTLTKKLKGLTHGKKYYVKVRAYVMCNDKRVFGEWSDVKSAVASSDKWGKKNGRKVYYKKGSLVKDKKIHIDGEPYYFDENGYYTAISRTMWKKIRDLPQTTTYAIGVSTGENRVVIYQRDDGNWKIYKVMKCACGAKGTSTPHGTFRISGRLKYGFGIEEENYWVYHATRIVEHIYFHSVLYYFYDRDVMKDGRLGMNLSHGCVRLWPTDAEWIHANISDGTPVVIVS